MKLTIHLQIVPRSRLFTYTYQLPLRFHYVEERQLCLYNNFHGFTSRETNSTVRLAFYVSSKYEVFRVLNHILRYDDVYRGVELYLHAIVT
jgi:hypothetical protein